MGLRGYVGQVLEVRPILEFMEKHGLPVDEGERLRLGEEFDAALSALAAELDGRYPDEIRKVHPKLGYKKVPKDTSGLVLRSFPAPGPTLGNAVHFNGHTLTEIGSTVPAEPVPTFVERWCRLEPFSPNSGPQLLRYMRHHRHPVPKKAEETETGEQKDTTAKKDLVRLAKKVGDDFYLKVIDYRELAKMKGTYIEGFKPLADGRVHTTFTFDTAIGQLASKNPNIQNFPKHVKLADAVRRVVAAEPGHLLVEWDYKSCHIITLGYLAGDPAYMRCGRIDMHSLVTGHKLGLWDLPSLLRDSDDAELRRRCKWLKQNPEWRHIRDARMKHAILGIGNGLKKRGLYEKHMEDFSSEKEAGEFLAVAESLFPRVFQWHEGQKKRAHDYRLIRTDYGHQRRFYEVYRWDWKKQGWSHGDQAEEAVAYELANIAFGYIREHMKLLWESRAAQRWGLCNNVHDSLLFHVPEERLEEHCAEVYPVLVRPSEVLQGPIAPEGLVIDAECKVGRNWSKMEEFTLKEVTLQ